MNANKPSRDFWMGNGVLAVVLWMVLTAVGMARVMSHTHVEPHEPD